MANRAFLVLNGSGDPNEPLDEERIAAAASYMYPVLWWSIFSSTDIIIRTEEWEDDDGTAVPTAFPCPFTALPTARRRATARQRFFFSYFPRTVEPMYQQWLALLDGIDAPYMYINTGDIWLMSDAERSNAEITTYARAFEAGQLDAWMALLEQAHIDLNPATGQITYRSLGRGDREVPEAEAELGYRLRGYQWERPVPWGDD